MSTGIVLLKEGHDESHIDDMKLGKKFWNIVDNVTIGLTQITDTNVVLIAGVNSQNSFPFEHKVAQLKTWKH